MPSLDASFLALPASTLADAALSRARELGAEHADFRLERVRTGVITLRDGQLESTTDDQELGLAVRVVHDGRLGLRQRHRAHPGGRPGTGRAGGGHRPAEPGAQLGAGPAGAGAGVPRRDLDLGLSSINPFEVPQADRVGRLTELSDRLLAADGVDHVSASLMQVQENKYYADTAGTVTTQQRVRIHPEFTAVQVDLADGGFSSMRTIAPPAGRGWEYLTGTGWDFDAEIAELPELLAEHVKAPSVEAGRYDLVIDPTNLWLTIHESIGHATELDRALGYEAAYAGTSFATLDKLNTPAVRQRRS